MTQRVNVPPVNVAAKVPQMEAGLEEALSPNLPITHEDEGDGSTTAFQPPYGHIPTRVYLNGNRQREGSGNDYEVTKSFDQYTVTFSTAPSLTDWVLIEVEITR